MDLKTGLQNLPPDAKESIVSDQFVRPFLNAIGYENLEIIREFPVGKKAVDYAARKTNDSDIFLNTRSNPYLYVEVKGRTENFCAESHPNYRKAAAQLRGYLLDQDSKTVKWGIITNGNHIQLFRKHGRVVHPMTPCIPVDDDIQKTAETFKRLIENPFRSLVVAIYNNKGGVGKTTTSINLAATLTMLKKRVLLIDFDPNQSDLGDALNVPSIKGELFEALKTASRNKDADIRSIITPYVFEHPRLRAPLSFDVLPADEKLGGEGDERKLRNFIRLESLGRALESVRAEYDYILIDAPPNWRMFAQTAIFASDVVLIPARHDNLHSLQNAGTAIRQFIPEMQVERRNKGDAGPIALPIFMNNAFKETPAQMELMHQAIQQIIKENKKDKIIEHRRDNPNENEHLEGIDLTPYFYPRYRKGQSGLHARMITIPRLAYISRADFMHVPAAFAFKAARDQYINLIKEYFIQ